jgi:hypothetical protein
VQVDNLLLPAHTTGHGINFLDEVFCVAVGRQATDLQLCMLGLFSFGQEGFLRPDLTAVFRIGFVWKAGSRKEEFGQCSKSMAAQLSVRRWLCRLAGCKGRVLLSPGLGRAGHPFIFGHGRNEGAGFRTLFEAKVWPGGASPAGT